MLSIYLITAIIVVGLILKLTDRTGHVGNVTPVEAAPECCGQHAVCERDKIIDETVEYFDDEELDSFVGRAADAYSADEVEQFRDVLLTLRPEEALDWSRSLERRGIVLPAALRDELLILIG